MDNQAKQVRPRMTIDAMVVERNGERCIKGYVRVESDGFNVNVSGELPFAFVADALLSTLGTVAAFLAAEAGAVETDDDKPDEPTDENGTTLH